MNWIYRVPHFWHPANKGFAECQFLHTRQTPTRIPPHPAAHSHTRAHPPAPHTHTGTPVPGRRRRPYPRPPKLKWLVIRHLELIPGSNSCTTCSPLQNWSFYFCVIFGGIFSDFWFVEFGCDWGETSWGILVLGHVWSRLGWSPNKSFTWAPRFCFWGFFEFSHVIWIFWSLSTNWAMISWE